MATSRQTARDALKTLLEAALVGDGLPCKTVTASKAETLEGLTPLVVILSRGSSRERLTYQGDRATFRLLVQVWLLQESGANWTQADAEDALDTIESIIADTYESNQQTTNWELLRYSDETRVFEATVAGVPYYVESIPTEIQLTHN